jgi:N-acetylneuraminate synthase
MDDMVTSIMIAGREIGPGLPCFIIAEAGVNHNGNLEMAYRLVDEAKRAGADAVKFQSFKANRLASAAAPKAPYQQEVTPQGESQQEMLRRMELPPEDHRKLFEHAQKNGILFLSSSFDEESAALLAQLPVAAFKIPSGELTNLPLLTAVSRFGRPIFLSTGMSTLAEVEQAVAAIRAVHREGLALLHCVSAYPAPAGEANLRAMETMRTIFHLPVGFSDHTQGASVSLAAVALGACVIEKHLTLDRTLPGPDHRSSLEPNEFAFLVKGIREVEMALGDGRKEPRPCEKEIAAVARKSLVAARHIPKGTPWTQELIAIQRPGTGLPPSFQGQVLGRTALKDIPEGSLLSMELLS